MISFYLVRELVILKSFLLRENQYVIPVLLFQVEFCMYIHLCHLEIVQFGSRTFRTLWAVGDASNNNFSLVFLLCTFRNAHEYCNQSQSSEHLRKIRLVV
jgi:hypothetical protein